jgi:urate oxidase
MKKKITYKKTEVVIDVALNAVQPPPPAFHDTVAKHFIDTWIEAYGWKEHREVSDLHFNAEIDKAEQAAKDFIDEKTKKLPAKVNVKTAEHIDKLSAKGFS